MLEKLRIALLISGGGTTMQAIIRACKDGVLKRKVEPALVISSRSDAGGIQKALAEGIPEKDVLVIRRKDYPQDEPEAFGEVIINKCLPRDIDFVGQYGWMVLTPRNVIEFFKGMMTNQHPGPPEFGGQGWFGLRVHCGRLYFVRTTKRDFWTEAIAQRVHPEYDRGVMVKSRRVEILPNDTPLTLQQRVLPVEHEVQIETLLDFANGTVTEIIRDTPLILPGEESILEEAKRVATILFPKG